MFVAERQGSVKAPMKPLNFKRSATPQALRYILEIDEKFIANVLVTAWLGLMVMYSRRFPVFAVAGLSTVGFGLLYRYLKALAVGWRVKGSVEHIINAMTTSFHAFTISLLAYYSVVTEGQMYYDDLRRNSSVVAKSAVGIAVGYFAYDLWHLVHADMVRQSPALMLHHLAIVGIYSTVIVVSQYYPYMVLTLLCEPHSLTMQLRKICKVAFDVPRGILDNKLQSNLYWGLWGVNLLLCILTRMIPHTAILYKVYMDRNNSDMFPETWLYNCAFGGMTMINVINIGLFLSLYKAYQKDVRIVKKAGEGER